MQLNEALGFHASQPCSDATAARPLLSSTARMIVMSSINGIAGSPGQTNYAYTKSALMGCVCERVSSRMCACMCARARAPATCASYSRPFHARAATVCRYVSDMGTHLAPHGITANAIAPGYIATPMTDKLPWMLRQIGQRSNALSQSGLPEDVAAAAAFLASPYSQAITGQTLRVCGGSIVGR
ncbi:SDR family oxidoreductase [archaeon]|nr:MAG: SDR family oxidoreductase [archaeon]